MNTHAAIARDNAISVETKLTGHAKRSDGGLNLRFMVHPHDIPQELRDAPIGTRYLVALVELNDDDTPKEHTNAAGNNASAGEADTAAPSASPSPIRKPTPPEQRLTKQSAITCNEPSFWRFLNETSKSIPRGCRINDGPEAAIVVRAECGVKSRTEIIPGTPAGDRWDALYSRYVVWRDVPEMAS